MVKPIPIDVDSDNESENSCATTVIQDGPSTPRDNDNSANSVRATRDALVRPNFGNADRFAKCTTNHRRWVLLTLDHVELRNDLPMDTCVYRIMDNVDVTRLVGCKEFHKPEHGYHYHFAIENASLRYNTATKKLRKLFPEFDGRAINVKFHKCWPTMLQYVTKEDRDWRNKIWGSYTAEEADLELKAKKGKTANCITAIRKHIDSGGHIASLVNNDDVAPFMLRNANSVLRFAQLHQEAAHSETTLEAIQREAETGSAATADRLLTDPQKEALLEFHRQLHGRVLRQPQLYCVGPPNTGKTYPFMLMAQSFSSCFIPCLENNERAFANYHDSIHDWIFFNDFHDNVKFQTLSNLCEGALMQLNGYGTQHLKRRNVPCVFTANDTPKYKNLTDHRRDALHSRLHFVEFSDPIMDAPPLSLQDLCKWIVEATTDEGVEESKTGGL